MRDVLLKAFSKEFAYTIWADESTILWTILRAAGFEWLDLIETTELMMRTEMRCTLDISIDILLYGLKEEVSFLESLELLKETLQIIKAKKGWKLPLRKSQSPNQVTLDLETDFQDLIRRYEAASVYNSRRPQMLAALVGIEESQRAISQSKKIG